MAAATARNLNDQVKERLRIRVAVHGRSMESEIRAILAAVSGPGETDGLLATMMERFACSGGVELDLFQAVFSRVERVTGIEPALSAWEEF
jgi:antitoxin FitA